MFYEASTHECKTFTQWFRIGLGIVLLTLAGSMAHAQLAGTGAISGNVQDPTGAVVAGATVTATNIGTNVAVSRTSTRAGDFKLTPLRPGSYMVTVAASGFEGYKQENVTVDALETVSLSVKLTVGQATETVTVSSVPPIIDTADASLGAVMDNQMYSNLPILMGSLSNMDQRRVTDFAYLMPGVQANSTNGNATSASGIVNGSGPNGGVQEIYIEGVNLPEADGVGDPRFTWTAIGVDAVDQFQMQTAGYSAQYAGQGVQNYSLKSGSNAIHGSMYEYLRNTIFDAWQFTSKTPTPLIPPSGTAPTACVFGSAASPSCAPNGVKPREIQNEFGIVLSGPIIKNKLFLFGNYGQYREQQGAKANAMTIPTLAMLGYDANGNPQAFADYSGYAANGGGHIYDPATQTPNCSTCTRTQFAGDHIPASRFSAASIAYAKLLLPYEAFTNQNAYSNNLVFGTPIGLANWYASGKIDYTQNSRNQIDVVIAFGRQAATGLNSASGLKPPFNTSQIFTPVTTVDIVRDAWTISSHVVNQLAIGFGRYKSDSVTPNRQPQYAASAAGITNMPGGQASDGFPAITWSSGSLPSPGSWGGYAWNNKINNTYNVTDNLQWIFGKHNFTVGGQYVAQEFNYYKVVSPSGPMGFQFNSTQTAAFTSGTTTSATTGSSVASYMLGAVNSSSDSVNVPGLGTRWRDPSFWAQDDYKLNDKLTLNLGLRWDIFPSITEAHNIFTWLNPKGINSITGNRGTLNFAGTGAATDLYCNCSSPSQIYWKNISPRIGFAYSLDSKTVVRGSYDVANARGNWTSGSQSGSPSTLGLTPSASAPAGISAAPAFYWDNTACTAGTADSVACGWTGSIVNPAPPAGGTSLAEYGTTFTTALTNTGSTTLTYFDPYYGSRTPEYQNWTFGLQRAITKDKSITVSYVGSAGHFLSVGSARWDKNNKLPSNYAAMANYNLNGTTATACTAATCGFGTGNTDLLGTKATTGALAAASTVGFTPMNPYSGGAAYYASNAVNQYYLPFPQYSGVTDTTSFVGNTSFHALEISLRQRNAHGLDFMLNYTYSKSIDDVGTFRQYDNNRLDRSISTTDQPQNLVATAVYQLPFGHGHIGGDNFWANALGGGWNLNGIFTYHSGVPLLATGSGCGGSSILGTCMPTLVPGQAIRQGAYGKNITAANGSPNYWAAVHYLNGAAFSVNQPGTQAQVGTQVATTTTYNGATSTTGIINYVGNGSALYAQGTAARVGAGGVFSMGYYDMDLGLKRLFTLHESVKLQFEADLSNVTNHTGWGSLVGGSTSSTFGTINTAQAGGLTIPITSTPRDAQFAVRLMF